MTLNTLRDVYEDQIKDLYNAESQLVRALPKMAKAASTPELKKAFEQHFEVTRKQKERLEKVCKDAGIKPTGKKCLAMEGLIKEGQEVIGEKGDGAPKDAALIAAAQKIEHYEISGYGSARTFARQLGLIQAAKLLDQTLQEESRTDSELTVIAERNVNRCAAEEAPTGNGAEKRAPDATKARASAKGGKSASRSSATTSKTTKSGSRSAKKSASASRTTTDHDEIRRWVEKRGGAPVCVKGTGSRKDIGILRIDFPGGAGEESFQPISWDEFFNKFEENNLAFLYQDQTADGSESRFVKLISRDNKKRN